MTALANRWPLVLPLVGVLLLAGSWGREGPPWLILLAGVALGGCVIAAVHHAEVVAHRVGEPFGSLVLAVAVTIIEVGLIITLMVAGGPDKATLARDTIFAAFVVTCNGIIGVSLLVATRRKPVVEFNAEGSGAALATVTALVAFTLVLPTFTETTAGPTFSSLQLGFVAVVSLVLYGLFVFAQTVRHRQYFQPVGDDPDDFAEPPTSA